MSGIFNRIELIALVYEGLVVSIYVVFLLLFWRRYKQIKNRLTLYLFLVFVHFFFAIIFSWLSKYLVLFSGLNYLSIENAKDPNTLESWILLRILDFRISFIFVSLASIFTYIFKFKLFEANVKKFQKYIVFCYGGFTAIYSLLIYEKDNILLDILAFFFIAMLIIAIYLPFMIKTIIIYKIDQQEFIKKKLLSLSFMAFFFILIFICFFIDRLLIFFGFLGYTIFYFLAWLWAIFTIMFAYIGYLRPKREGN
jgi:hypothetical protein